MADSLGTYFNPQNVGAATVLESNTTPLALLQQEQALERKRVEDEKAAKLAKEKQIAENIGKIKPVIGKIMPGDQQYINDSLRQIRDYVAEGAAKGKDYTNFIEAPEEAAKLNTMLDSLNTFAKLSEQDLTASNDYIALLQGDKEGKFNREKGWETYNAYMNAATPEERRKITLSTNPLYNIAGIATKLFEKYEPEEDTTFTRDGKGGVVHQKIKTYSEKQLGQMTNLLTQDSGFRESKTEEFNSLSDEQKKEVGGLYGYLESQARAIAEDFQRKDIERKYGVDSAELQRQRMAQQERHFQMNFNKEEDKELQQATERVQFNQQLAKGQWSHLKGFVNTKVAGGYVHDVKAVVPPNGGQPKYILTVSDGTYTDGETGEKVKITQKRDVVIDTSRPGWDTTLNNILSAGDGQANVRVELYEKVKKDGGYDLGTNFLNSPKNPDKNNLNKAVYPDFGGKEEDEEDALGVLGGSSDDEEDALGVL